MHAQSLRQTLLPNEPRIADRQRQDLLTARLLLPNLTEIELFFLDMRRRIDEQLAPLKPAKHGKPYPLGQCLEISRAVHQALALVDSTQFSGMAARGCEAVLAFFRSGGRFVPVWGDLRGRFFQNAFLLGSLYVDVSNDTVVPTKPKVEIMPFEQADLSPIRDYDHYMRIAGSYWEAQFVPNHILPALAPYYPVLGLNPRLGVMLFDNGGYMMALTHARQFRASASVLQRASMSPQLFGILARQLAGSGLEVAADAGIGQLKALHYCRAYRGEKRVFGDRHAHEAARHYHVAAARMATIRVQPK